MTPRSLTYTGDLTITTCWCGTRHAVPTELYSFQERQHRDGGEVTSIYCPLGHAHVPAGKGRAAIERERREQLEAQLTAAQDQLAAERREAKRAVKRAAAGVCPCCQRSFVQMQRHMKAKHPEFIAEAGR